MKFQAEIAGRLTREHEGTVLRDPELLLADGTGRLLSAVRGRSNLVMIFTAGQDLTAVTASLAGNAGALEENNARVLVITPAADGETSVSNSQASSHAIALDHDGKIHRLLGASDAAGNLLPTIYITDRFGEVFAAFQNPSPTALPSAAEITRWLEFINQQCEECSPPEWPE